MLRYGYDRMLGYLERLGMINLLEAAAGSVIPALVYGYGGYLVIQHRVSLGYVIACLQYLGRSLGSVTSLGNIPMMFRPVFAHAERLERTLAIPPRAGTIPWECSVSRRSLEDVSIGYDGPNSTLVSGINLLICAGETISLVGPSGSGKTSIAMVLCGLYRPQWSYHCEQAAVDMSELQRLQEAISVLYPTTTSCFKARSLTIFSKPSLMRPPKRSPSASRMPAWTR